MEAVSLKLKQTKIKHSEVIKDESEDRGSSTAALSLKLPSAWETLREICNFSNGFYFSNRINIGISTAVKEHVRGTILRTHHVDAAILSTCPSFYWRKQVVVVRTRGQPVQQSLSVSLSFSPSQYNCNKQAN